MTFQAVLFDLDGTLLNTADDLGAALNTVLIKHDRQPLSKALYTVEASNGSLAMLRAGFGAKDWPSLNHTILQQQFLDYYLANIAQHTHYYPAIESLLLSLNERNIQWGIVTNKPTFLTLPLLQHFTLLAKCKAVVCGDTLQVAKPYPEPLLLAATRLDVAPSACLYVGDAQRDIQAGQAAQMKTAIANWGYIASTDDILSWHADFICADAQQLSNYI